MGVQASVFREVAIALMYVGAIVVGLALSSTRIPQEIERRTVFNVVARDVPRWQYVAGTWLGMFVVLGGVVAACAVATIAIGFFTMPGNEIMWRLFEGAFAVWLEVGVDHGVHRDAVVLVRHHHGRRGRLGLHLHRSCGHLAAQPA